MQKIIIIIFYYSLFNNIIAELPLTVEDIITNKGNFKLDFSLNYANLENTNIQTGREILISTNKNSFIAVPTLIAKTYSNYDIFISTLSLYYGLRDCCKLIFCCL